VVYGTKEICRKKGWPIGNGRIKEKEQGKCLGNVFEKGGRRNVSFKAKMGKAGAVVASLAGTRKMLGEQAAMSAWRVFGRSVLISGAEVMVWDTIDRKRRMDVLERKAMRTILALDKGANDQLVYGEMAGNKVSVEAELRTIRFGEKVEKMKETDVRKMMWNIRMDSSRDRWMKYVEGVKDSLEDIDLWDKSGLRRSWVVRLKEREHRNWVNEMKKSKQSSEVYREVVSKRGEIERWDMIHQHIRVWWRRFRGGTLMGKRRQNGWRNTRCEVCGVEEGGIGHFIFRCQNDDVKELRKDVLVGIESDMNDEQKEKWKNLTNEERLWTSLGWSKKDRQKGVMNWWENWERGKWSERVDGRLARSEP
jgi:hypothetical protein